MSAYLPPNPVHYPSAQIPPQYVQQGAPQYNPVPQPYPRQAPPHLQQHQAPPQSLQYQGQFNPVPQQQGRPQPYSPSPLSPYVPSSNAPNFPQTGYYNPQLPTAAPNGGYYTVRVIAGTHRGTRSIYRVGDTFKTRDPLHLMFENKFQLVPDAPAIIEDSAIMPDRMIPKTPEEVAAARLNSAIHQGVHGVIPPSPSAPPVTPPQPFSQNSVPVDEPPTNTPFPFADAEDVTKRFPKAAKNGMEIWKHTTLGYAINMIDTDNPDNRFNIADTELKTMIEVQKLLAEMGF